MEIYSKDLMDKIMASPKMQEKLRKLLFPERAPAVVGAVRRFPLQPTKGRPAPTSCPWSVADKAYSQYVIGCGRQQSLERLAERGGFGLEEMDRYYPGWEKDPAWTAAPAPAAVREAVAEKISGMRVLLTRIKTNIPDCDESCKCWQWQLHRDMAAMDSDLSHLKALAAAKMEGA